ncbi:hypothetical protein CC1_12390 [Coprococcus catus GD/7]|uniref:Uncharacterized protein n=1 Tax=Coprococcus catus GD/7 TaxID=717962 RepID=D4J6S7_9FIRM|nr:hypothetical protein CC1_12390 [Coprococcus catus GD/7]
MDSNVGKTTGKRKIPSGYVDELQVAKGTILIIIKCK